MLKDWQAMAAELTGDIRSLRAGAPDVMKGFSALAQAALKADALDTKTKELIALAIAVATRCDGCIAFRALTSIFIPWTCCPGYFPSLGPFGVKSSRVNFTPCS